MRWLVKPRKTTRNDGCRWGNRSGNLHEVDAVLRVNNRRFSRTIDRIITRVYYNYVDTKPNKGGRPPVADVARLEIIKVRLTADEKELVRRAAVWAGDIRYAESGLHP